MPFCCGLVFLVFILKPINICTDSHGVIEAINGYKITTLTVLECRDTLQKISESNQVSLTWVPGQSDIAENEKTD